MKNNNTTSVEGRRGNGIFYTKYSDGKVIKADLDDTMFDAIDVIEKIFRSTNPKSFFITTFFEDSRGFHIKNEMLLKDRYTGKAKCNTDEGDKVNEEIGKEYARGRCLERYRRAFDKRILTLLNDARALVACTEHYCERAGIDINQIDSVEQIKSHRFNYGK